MIETPAFGHAATAAPHAAAAAAGRDVLLEGGNALEAMVAMSAVIAVVYPHMSGIGGDGFWLVGEPGRRGATRCIEASGPAGALATRQRYLDKGYDRLPARGPDAAITVPWAVAGWAAALELAAARGGRLPLRRLLEPAILAATAGTPVSRSEATYEPMELPALQAAPGFRDAFAPEGKVPGAGEVRRMPALGATLEQLAHAGLADFYRGDVAREMAGDLARIGAPVTREDLRHTQARWRRPLSLSLPGVTVFNTRPPTQGLASLVILGLFARLGVKAGESFAHVHGLIEAGKRGLMVRDRVCTARGEIGEVPEDYLAAGFLDRLAAGIDRRRATAPAMPEGDGGTTWMGCIDAEGLAVSSIQSLYWDYGSGCVLPRTGVLMQNRGLSFTLDPDGSHPLAPGRLPLQTLNPPLARYDDGRVLAYGAMGGDGQPQFQAQVFTRLGFGMNPAAAVDAPRFLYGRSWGDPHTRLRVENRFDPDLLAALEKAGHEMIVEHAYSDRLGHAGALLRFPAGRIEAAHDPRSDGDALGF